MSSCSAYGCTNRSERKPPGVTFHLFPKDRIRKKAWTIALKRKDFKPTQYTRVCSEHFANECFLRTKKVVKLKPNAIPTIFKKFPEHLKNVSTMSPLADFISDDVIKIEEDMGDDNPDESVDFPLGESVDDFLQANADENIDSLSESVSSEDESSSEAEPPDTDVIYVSEEGNEEGNAPASAPRIIKVIPHGGPAKGYPKDPKLDQDIKDALCAYAKFRGTKSIEELRGKNISLVVIQPNEQDDEISIFLNEEGKLKTEEELLAFYEDQKREIKALRQRTFRYEEKIKKLEKVIENFTSYKSSGDEVEDVSDDEDISEEAIFQELLKRQKKEAANETDSDMENSSPDSDAGFILGVPEPESDIYIPEVELDDDIPEVELDDDVSEEELEGDVSEGELEGDVSEGELEGDASEGELEGAVPEGELGDVSERELDDDISEVELDDDTNEVELDGDNPEMMNESYVSETESNIDDSTVES